MLLDGRATFDARAFIGETGSAQTLSLCFTSCGYTIPISIACASGGRQPWTNTSSFLFGRRASGRCGGDSVSAGQNHCVGQQEWTLSPRCLTVFKSWQRLSVSTRQEMRRCNIASGLGHVIIVIIRHAVDTITS